MEFAELVIVFAVTITLSNIASRILPMIPAPLIQIFLGVVLGLTEWGQSIDFEPELFLVMIIAPLLFREGEKADISSILKNFGTILFLAFGGVILTLVGVGATLSFLLPSVPLAACFAFGAALGPTDAVAVSSLSGRVNIPKKAMHILEGEGLLNDASGVTAFQFALGALITGSFSAVNAGMSLVVSSIGGALIGFLLVWFKQKIIHLIEKASAQDVTGYLLIELLLPFLAYVLAEAFDVSGIIAAVAAGILQASGFRKISVFDAELSSLSHSTWTTIAFTLNALVFIFLGIELTQVFSPVWGDGLYPNGLLLAIIVLISVMLFVIRFISISLFYVFKDGSKKFKKQLNEILILTFGGVKGTVSLATIFILPFSINNMMFYQRSLLLFLTAGVILVTLVIGIIVLPMLTITSQILSFIGFWFIVVRRLMRIVLHPKMFWQRRYADRQTFISDEDIQEIRETYQKNTQLIIESLDNLTDIYDETMVQFFIQQRKLEGIKMNSGNLISSWMIQQDSLFTKKMLRGYYLERKIIDEYEVAEKITTFSANSYRRNINLLESYTMNKPSDNFSFRFAFRAKSKKTSPIK
ncbi:sodium:proton antiporter [Enterococcus faecium]